jgi:hypothetical protein
MISLYQGEKQIICHEMYNESSVGGFMIGAAIMIMSLVLFENEFLHIVSISFTALILNELIMVALEITTWYVVNISGRRVRSLTCHPRHIYMVVSEIVTLFFYIISIAFLPEYFGTSYLICLAQGLSTHTVRRSHICRYAWVCVEGGGHCSNQCSSAVHHQGHP